MKAVATTVERIAEGKKATGWPTLAAAIRDGTRVVDVLHEWLGLRSAEKAGRITALA